MPKHAFSCFSRLFKVASTEHGARTDVMIAKKYVFEWAIEILFAISESGKVFFFQQTTCKIHE